MSQSTGYSSRRLGVHFPMIIWQLKTIYNSCSWDLTFSSDFFWVLYVCGTQTCVLRNLKNKVQVSLATN